MGVLEECEVARYPEVVVGEVGKQLMGDWASVGLLQRLHDVPPRVVDLFVTFGVLHSHVNLEIPGGQF